MFEPFDVLKLDSENQPMWQESAPTLGGARSRVQELATSCPGDYLIFCQKTGHKIVIKTPEVAAAQIRRVPQSIVPIGQSACLCPSGSVAIAPSKAPASLLD